MTIIQVLAQRTVAFYNADRLEDSEAIYNKLCKEDQQRLLDAVIVLVGPLL
jgi:hypothetical protein